MIHETDKNNDLIVEEVKFNLEEYIEDYIRDKNLEESIRRANILLLPYQNFREQEGPIFPEAYLEFYYPS